jgi:putative phosphoesterase
MRIGVVSDTHMPSRAREIPAALADQLRAVDLILHAGDLTTMAALESLRSIAPVEAVSGNVDEAAVRQVLPKTRTIQAGRFRIGLVHGDGPSTTIDNARRAFSDVDCIVFGHSHTPTVETHRGILMVNPGSPTDPRREPRPSFAIITADETLEAKIFYL